MSEQGRVTARSGLNVRQTPGGQKIGSLAHQAVVDIRHDHGDWLEISFNGGTAYVSSLYIERQESAPAPASATGGFGFIGKDAVAPNGEVFGRKFRKGIFNYGRTSIGSFIEDRGDLFVALSPSLVNVMQAVSENEGKLEAINTWDNSFMTFGVFQWTAGADSARGELAALLDRLKQDNPNTFDRFFGSAGIDVSNISGSPARGWISLNGNRLDNSAEKEVLRGLNFAYLFWKAGQDDDVRKAQISHAMGRIDTFYDTPGKRIAGRPVSAYVTSEYGVALLLDQHVNRPGHVPKILQQAYDDFLQEGGTPDPSGWGYAEEARLLKLYLYRRHKTSMTDSLKRAQTTLRAVMDGRASDQRGSYSP